MKILFLCGCLEPGHDGVGDYTRRLAIELLKRGYQVAAMSLNDPKTKKFVNNVQSEELTNLDVFRIPSELPEKVRFDLAKRCIETLNPDLLSLQFVPFSFHPKGLSFKLSRQLKIIGQERSWHIMFHELWVGMEANSSVMLKSWGKVQEWLIKSLVLALKPRLIHTQSRLYQLQLSKISVAAKHLPLFSNIPVIKNTTFNAESKETYLLQKKTYVFILFGGVHPDSPVEKFIEEAALFARKNDYKLILKIIGKRSKEQEHWAESWRNAGLSVEMFDEQPSDKVSVILKSGSFGISTTPSALIEKSGTVSAMIEHKLPVICVRNPWRAHGMSILPLNDGISVYEEGNFEHCLSSPPISSFATVSNVSSTFIADLDISLSKRR